MNQYGAPYMGSKSKIAEDILAILPRGKRFVDLFGGGFAMTHCAMLSGKYEEFYYNELNPLVVDMIKKAIAGEYKNERRWIDRETFFNLKDTDGYVKLCWSYEDYQYKDGDVVYCDPPYENTAKYSEDGFNHKKFYDWVAGRPYKVYFSSYEISDTRFYKVWSKEKTQLLNGQGARAKVQETVYCNQPEKVMLF